MEISLLKLAQQNVKNQNTERNFPTFLQDDSDGKVYSWLCHKEENSTTLMQNKCAP